MKRRSKTLSSEFEFNEIWPLIVKTYELYPHCFLFGAGSGTKAVWIMKATGRWCLSRYVIQRVLRTAVDRELMKNWRTTGFDGSVENYYNCYRMNNETQD